MAEYGVTDEGFKRKRLDVLLDEIDTAVKLIFGENFNVSPESPDGQINGVVAESNANIWEIAEEAYNAFNPNAATGSGLSNLVQLNGIIRRAATYSTVTLTVTGTNGTLIPAGSLVSTVDTNSQFTTDADVTIPVGLTTTVEATAVITGPIIALATTISVIDTLLTGWDTVNNVSDATEGQDEETDVELRARREKSVARDATAIVDAIFAEVLAVDGVTQLTVLENETNTGPDVNGLPAHSVEVIVVGGTDADIAQAIFVKKTLGATAHGDTTIQVADNQGINHPIKFSRPTEIDIFVIVNLTVFADYPSDGDDQIKQAILDYAFGDLVNGRGFGLGDDVIHSEIYTPINTVEGHTVDSMFIKISAPADQTADITIGDTEISNFTLVNITVNTV